MRDRERDDSLALEELMFAEQLKLEEALLFNGTLEDYESLINIEQDMNPDETVKAMRRNKK